MTWSMWCKQLYYNIIERNFCRKLSRESSIGSFLLLFLIPNDTWSECLNDSTVLCWMKMLLSLSLSLFSCVHYVFYVLNGFIDNIWFYAYSKLKNSFWDALWRKPIIFLICSVLRSEYEWYTGIFHIVFRNMVEKCCLIVSFYSQSFLLFFLCSLKIWITTILLHVFCPTVSLHIESRYHFKNVIQLNSKNEEKNCN